MVEKDLRWGELLGSNSDNICVEIEVWIEVDDFGDGFMGCVYCLFGM